MKRILQLPIFVLLPISVSAQNCDCVSQFAFVKNHYEKNNPAFQKIKNDTILFNEYDKAVSDLNKEIKNEKSAERCFVWLEKYIALLKDHHSGIDMNLQRLPFDFNAQNVIVSFRNTTTYKAFKTIPTDTTLLYSKLASKPLSGIEGIYTNGGTITFGLLQTSKNYYTAIVLKKSKLLDVGHVLLTIEGTENPLLFNSIYNAGLLGFNIRHFYKTIEIENGKMPVYGFYKVGYFPNEDKPVFSFKSLNAQTNYLQLTSFDFSLQNKLDSFYKSIDSAITSKPFLVIDLRNNGGGSEQCYLNLLPYVYTQPLTIDDVEVWVSPHNIKQYENYQNKDDALINRMKKAQSYSFIPRVENPVSEWTIAGTKHPLKVAILYNRHTASAAEGLITYAIQSSKVVTMGENSGGYLGYGNVMTTSTPCGTFSLRSTTTKYKKNSKYEFVGIAPMIEISSKSDWIEEAIKALY